MRARALVAVVALALGGCHHQKTVVVRRTLAPGHGVAGASPKEAELALHQALAAGDRVTAWYSMSAATQAAVLPLIKPMIVEMDAGDDDKVGQMAHDLGLTVAALRALPAEELAVAVMSRAGSDEERAALGNEQVTQVDTPSPDLAVVTTVADGQILQKHFVREGGVWKADLTKEIAEALAPPPAPKP